MPLLEKLNLSDNRIIYIKGFNKLANLQELNLSHNMIKEVSNLDNNSRLTKLNLSYNEIEDSPNLIKLKSLQVFLLNKVDTGFIL